MDCFFFGFFKKVSFNRIFWGKFKFLNARRKHMWLASIEYDADDFDDPCPYYDHAWNRRFDEIDTNDDQLLE